MLYILNLRIFNRKYGSVTIYIILVNIAMYILNIVVNGSTALTGVQGEHILRVGGMDANSNPFIMVISLFVHRSTYHLIFNMMILYIVGGILEKVYSSKIYLFVYLFAGLIGNVVTINFIVNGTSCGASGAIFGLLGLLLTASLIPNGKINNNIDKILLYIIVISVFIGTFISAESNTNVYAHIMGFLIGILSGILLNIYKLLKGVIGNEKN